MIVYEWPQIDKRSTNPMIRQTHNLIPKSGEPIVSTLEINNQSAYPNWPTTL